MTGAAWAPTGATGAARFVLFDQVGLKHKCLDLVVHDDEFEICDVSFELSGFPIGAAFLEIRTDAVSQVLRLADVDDLAAGIFV